MPCPFATELARSTTQLHAVQMERAKAAKGKDPIRLIKLDRMLIQLNRAHAAAVRADKDARKRNSTPHMRSAAE